VRSYPLFIDGVEEPGKGWTYVVRASEQIRDLEGAFTFKRQLELGHLDPAAGQDGRIAGRCAWGGVDESRRAVAAAARASVEFSRFPLRDRVALVAAVHERMKSRADEIVEILVAEGHPRRLAKWELDGLLAASCPETLGWLSAQLEQEFEWNGRQIKIVRKPDGVVCVNPPQNAAASNAFMGVQGLIPGNALVVRAPQGSPLGVMYMYHEILRPLLDQWGAPPGTVNLISGEGRALVKSWVADLRVDSILFFGDSKLGLRVGRDCAERDKKAVLELSGNDGLVVWRDADLDGAAEALLECFYGSSQICMVPKFAIVHPEVADAFLDGFLARVRTLAPGYPEDPETVLTPVFKVGLFLEMLAEAKNEGARVLCGGRRVDVDGTPSHKGLFVEPTVVRVDGFELAERLACVREETFFPLLPVVVPSRSEGRLLDRTLEFVNTNSYGLRNSLWTRNEETMARFMAEVRNGGILKVNESHIGFLPYIATHGGSGRTGGPFGEMNYACLRLSRLQGIAIGRSG